jgi:hypothetical protein
MVTPAQPGVNAGPSTADGGKARKRACTLCDLYRPQLDEEAQLKRIKRLRPPPLDIPDRDAIVPSPCR